MKKNKILSSVILLAMLMLLSLNFISAIGVTPGKTTIPYPSGLGSDNIYSFTVLDDDEDVEYTISIGGELGEYISMESYPGSLYPYKESDKFAYTLDIPEDVVENLSAGYHEADIIITKKVDEEIFAVAIPSVVHKVVFFIPYPSKYLESRIEILEAGKNETTEFIMPIVNLGEEKIENVYAYVKISDKNGGISIDNFTTASTSLESMERKDLIAEWNNTVEANIYRAEVNLIYDDEIATYYKYFKVGNVFIDVSDILIEDFEIGSIVKFQILADNQWGEDLDDIYAKMELYTKGGRLAYEVDSPVDSIKAFERKRIPIYWDTTGVKEGEYDGRLIVYYDLYKTEKSLHVEIFEDDIRIQIQKGDFVLATPSYNGLIFFLSLIILTLIAIITFKKLTKKK